jgi:hypothetical protein
MHAKELVMHEKSTNIQHVYYRLAHVVMMYSINKSTFAPGSGSSRYRARHSSESSSGLRKLACFRHGMFQNCIKVRRALAGELLVHRVPCSFLTSKKDRLLHAADSSADD